MESPDREFARGDRVRSPYHGAVMVVEEVYAPIFHFRYLCRWADADGPRREVFRAKDLRPAEEPTAV
jgi:uncharacterized protein YodC (DUF2158 family)